MKILIYQIIKYSQIRVNKLFVHINTYSKYKLKKNIMKIMKNQSVMNDIMIYYKV